MKNMLFLNIYVAFCLLTFVLVAMQSYLVSKHLKRKYPESMNKFCKDNKSGFLEKVFSWTKTFISCFVPIINIGIFYVALFSQKQVEEKVLKDMSINE